MLNVAYSVAGFVLVAQTIAILLLLGDRRKYGLRGPNHRGYLLREPNENGYQIQIRTVEDLADISEHSMLHLKVFGKVYNDYNEQKGAS